MPSGVPVFHGKMKQHGDLPPHLAQSRSSPQKAAGLCHGPRGASAAPSSSPEHGEEPQHEDSLSPSAMEAVAQRRNPVRLLPHDQLMAAAEIPHVATYLRLQSCERMAGTPCRPLLPSARAARSIPQQGVPQGGSAKSQ